MAHRLYLLCTGGGPTRRSSAPSRFVYDKRAQTSIIWPSPDTGTMLVVSVGSLTKVKRPIDMKVPATGSRAKFLPVIAVLTLPFSRVLLWAEPVMLNVACSPLARFVTVANAPGEVIITPPLPCSTVFVLPLTSSCIGKEQWPGNWARTSGP